MTFYFFDDVLLLNLTLETTESVLEGLTLLKSYFRQLTTPPILSRWTTVVITTFVKQVKQ